MVVPITKMKSVEKETSNEFFEDWNESHARISLIVFCRYFILFSREAEYLKRRNVVKYLKSLRVLIVEVYNYFLQ